MTTTNTIRTTNITTEHTKLDAPEGEPWKGSPGTEGAEVIVVVTLDG